MVCGGVITPLFPNKEYKDSPTPLRFWRQSTVSGRFVGITLTGNLVSRAPSNAG